MIKRLLLFYLSARVLQPRQSHALSLRMAQETAGDSLAHRVPERRAPHVPHALTVAVDCYGNAQRTRLAIELPLLRVHSASRSYPLPVQTLQMIARAHLSKQARTETPTHLRGRAGEHDRRQ